MLVPLLDVDQAFAEVDSFRRRVDALLGTRGLDGRHGLRTLRPQVGGWTKEDDAYVVSVDVPGVTAEDVALTVEGRRLSLQLSRTPTPPDGASVRHRERRALDWSRAVTLPDDADPSTVDAELRHGVLTVRIGLRPTSTPRTIVVQS